MQFGRRVLWPGCDRTGGLLKMGLAVWWFLCCSPAAWAQDPGAGEGDLKSGLEQVRARIIELEQESSVSEEVRLSAVERLQAAVTSYEAALSHAASAQAFREQIEAAPRLEAELRQELSDELPSPLTALLGVSDPERLQLELARVRSELATQRGQQQQQAEQLETLRARAETIGAEIASARERVAALDLELEAAVVAESTPQPSAEALLAEVRRAVLRAERRERLEWVARLQQEELSWPMRLALLEVRQERDTRAVVALERVVEEVDRRLTAARAADAEEAAARAQQAQAVAANRPEAVREALQNNADLARERSEWLNKRGPAVADLAALQRQHDQWVEIVDNSRRFVRRSRLGASVGELLRERRDRIPRQLRGSRQIASRWDREFAVADARLFEIELDRGQLKDRDAAVRDLTIAAGRDPESVGADGELRAIVDERASLLESFSVELGEFVTTLRGIGIAERDLEGKLGEFEAMLDELLLWIPDAPTVGTDSWSRFVDSASIFAGPAEGWGTVWTRSVQQLRRSWLWGVLAVAVLVTLLLRRSFARTRFAVLERQTRSIATDRISATLECIAWHGWLAAPVPFVLVFCFWILDSASGGVRPSLLGALADGLLWSAGSLFALLWIRELTKPPGSLVERHFGWRPATAVVHVHREVSWFWPIIVLTLVINVAEGLRLSLIHISEPTRPY